MERPKSYEDFMGLFPCSDASNQPPAGAEAPPVADLNHRWDGLPNLGTCDGGERCGVAVAGLTRDGICPNGGRGQLRILDADRGGPPLAATLNGSRRVLATG